MNATDGNDNTSTTEGRVRYNAIGIIQLNLSSVRRGIIYSKLGLRSSNIFGDITVYWNTQISPDGINYVNMGAAGGTFSSSETVFYSGIPFWGRYIRFEIRGWDDPEVGPSDAYARLYEVYLKANE